MRKDRDNYALYLATKGQNKDFISIDPYTFEGIEIDREAIRLLFDMHGIDTHSWEYYTDNYGYILLS